MSGLRDVEPPSYDVPKRMSYAIFGDSGVRIYPNKGKAKDVHIHLPGFHEVFANKTIRGKGIPGAVCKDIADAMLEDDRFRDGSYDVVTVICFLNGAMDKHGTYTTGEPAGLEYSFRHMCHVLRTHAARPFLIVGGSAELW